MQMTRLIDEVVYVNQDCIKPSDDRTTPPHSDNYQNAIFRELAFLLFHVAFVFRAGFSWYEQVRGKTRLKF